MSRDKITGVEEVSVRHKNNYRDAANSSGRKLKTLGVSALIGTVSGGIVVLYRFVLTYAEDIYFKVFGYVREHIFLIFPVFVVLVLLGIIIGWLTSKFKMIGGSGIPQVKGIIMGHFKMDWIKTISAKFIGGALAVLGGLSLGREGPSIQLGACAGQGIGIKFGKTRNERRIYIASGASAGLSAAFNAPLAGVIFCLEEIFKYFSPIILLSTMISAVAADFVSRIFFGSEAIFDFDVTKSIDLRLYWLLVILGVVLGVFGALYNFLILKSQAIYKKIALVNGKLKMVIPFIISGIFGILFPVVMCGGHMVMEELHVSASIIFLIVLFMLKLLFSAISFGSGAPGGIFFPLLTIGAVVGAIFAKLTFFIPGVDTALFYNFIILAMAGYFTAIVRAPITGIVLLVEMTGSFTHLLPLTIVSIMAYVTADLLKSKPIYDSLLENMLKDAGKQVSSSSDDDKKITIEQIVRLGSLADKKRVKDLSFPESCLLIAVRRGEREIIPNGSTKLLAGDMLVCLCDLPKETLVREKLNILTHEKKG